MLEVIFISVVVSEVRCRRDPEKRIGFYLIGGQESTIPGLLDELKTGNLLTIRLVPNPMTYGVDLIFGISDRLAITQFSILKIGPHFHNGIDNNGPPKLTIYYPSRL